MLGVEEGDGAVFNVADDLYEGALVTFAGHFAEVEYLITYPPCCSEARQGISAKNKGPVLAFPDCDAAEIVAEV